MPTSFSLSDVFVDFCWCRGPGLSLDGYLVNSTAPTDHHAAGAGGSLCSRPSRVQLNSGLRLDYACPSRARLHLPVRPAMPPKIRADQLVLHRQPPRPQLQRREERGAQRRRVAERTHVPDGLSFLENATIRPGTRREYERKVQLFLEWVGEHQTDWDSYGQLDQLLVEFFDEKFFQGYTSDEGAKLLAGLCFFDIKLYKTIISTLPRAHRAMKGWMKTGPADQRLPFPLVLLYPVVAWLVHHDEIDKGLALLIQHNGYLRPSELTSLTVMQLISPLAGARAPYDQWAVNIAPFELLRPAKTGMMDESITLDYMKWAEPCFQVLVTGRDRREPLFKFDMTELSTSFALGVEQCQLQHLRPGLYSLRHGGASEDYLRRRRTLEEIQRRGRWRAAASVRRYTKEAKLLSELHKVDPRIIRYGHYIETNIAMLFTEPGKVDTLAGFAN